MPDASDLLRSLCFPCYGHHRDLHSFPTRRSSDLIVLGEAAERALAVRLLEFGTVVTAVGTELEPHRLCGFLFDLAQDFSAFYEQCPVLKADDPDVRASRLALASLTLRVLAQGLDLLGIESPERM